MTDVLEEMEAKEKGSWGMEMALFNKRAKQISEEIPKLFIGKAFKQKCESEPGARVPHFLANVEQEEGGGWRRMIHNNWLKPKEFIKIKSGHAHKCLIYRS